ncbi:MAG: DNA polymerase III subunit beta [Clostridia bacterium]|nr:DNA polymerase III subunit beta [Clostridia bacterium]
MKIVFKKSKLLEKLYPCMGTVSTKNSIPSIEGVLIETMGGNTVRLSTYDMNKGVRATLEAESVIEPGSYIISAGRLLQIIKVLSEDELTIAVDENLNTTVTSGKASFSLSALPGKDFPTMPELTGPRGFEVESEILKDMISKVLHSVAEQDSRPMLCGAFFRIMENRMELISCDSYTLSRRAVSCDLRDVGEVSVLDFSFLVPGHALNELVRILGDGDEITCVKIARKHAIFFFDDIIFFTRMIDSEYIDYERIIPKDQTIHITVERDRLLAALERATLIAEERIVGSGRSYVKLILDGNVMSITSTSVNGKVYDEMPVTHEGENLEIGFNCRYLINSIRASEGELLDLSFQSPTQSVTIRPHEKSEEKSFFYMVLPVRMNG